MAHISVLLDVVLEWLQIRPEGTYVDCTLGAGGYTEAIAGRLTTGRLIAIDRDPQAIDRVRERLGDAGGRIKYVRSSYGELERILEGTLADGIVADLGLSRDQIEDPARGFSFSSEGPLDMRMDPDGPLTAADIVNTYGEKPLADLIYQFGEERRSRRIARAIVRARPLTSTRQLAEAIGRAAPRTPRDRIHPATRTFQALRIAVNDELGELEKLLEAAPPRLGPGGRFLVVSFHSLEDRLVKQSLRRWAGLGQLQILTKHVIRPDDAETERNPASRSARLRVAERKVDEWP
jgi:16S rRNA (cytosine1402-N4)-methyltransferase